MEGIKAYFTPLYEEADKLRSAIVRLGYSATILDGPHQPGKAVDRIIKHAYVYCLTRYARREDYDYAEVAQVIGGSYNFVARCYQEGQDARSGDGDPLLKEIINNIKRIREDERNKD